MFIGGCSFCWWCYRFDRDVDLSLKMVKIYDFWRRGGSGVIFLTVRGYGVMKLC
jgi:hypothetical protein